MKGRSISARAAPRGWLVGRSFVSRLTTWRGVTQALPRAARPGAPALDVGCGDRPFDVAIRARGFRPVGIDLRGPADVRGSADALPFNDDIFPLVTAVSVLPYVSDLSTACAEILRVMEPGGVAVLRVPAAAPLDEEALWRWTPHSVTVMLEEAGFVDVELAPLGTTPATILHLLAVGIWRSVPVVGPVIGALVELLAVAALRVPDHRLPLGYVARARKATPARMAPAPPA